MKGGEGGDLYSSRTKLAPFQARSRSSHQEFPKFAFYGTTNRWSPNTGTKTGDLPRAQGCIIAQGAPPYIIM